MLLVMMVTSKGIAGVPRASLVVVAATVPMFGLPAAGILLIMGVDQILDMGRTVTNVLGNGLATAAVARWQGEMREGRTTPSRRPPRSRPARRPEVTGPAAVAGAAVPGGRCALYDSASASRADRPPPRPGRDPSLPGDRRREQAAQGGSPGPRGRGGGRRGRGPSAHRGERRAVGPQDVAQRAVSAAPSPGGTMRPQPSSTSSGMPATVVVTTGRSSAAPRAARSAAPRQSSAAPGRGTRRWPAHRGAALPAAQGDEVADAVAGDLGLDRRAALAVADEGPAGTAPRSRATPPPPPAGRPGLLRAEPADADQGPALSRRPFRRHEIRPGRGRSAPPRCGRGARPSEAQELAAAEIRDRHREGGAGELQGEAVLGGGQELVRAVGGEAVARPAHRRAIAPPRPRSTRSDVGVVDALPAQGGRKYVASRK